MTALDGPERRWLLALSDERDKWLARLLAAEEAAFDAGRSLGREEGTRAVLEADAAWFRYAIRPGVRDTLAGPDWAELERRRWGPGGRAGAMLAGDGRG